MAVPYTFGTATAAIPLTQLDSNFSTAITIGNTAVYLGNTTTSLGNVTLTNVTITSGTSNITTNVATVTGTLPEANGGTGTTTGYYGFKNRIINGAMVIDQRNAGASVSITTSNQYTLDRWQAFNTQASKFSVQQNAGSVTPPSGFSKYYGATSSSAYSVLTGDIFGIVQVIEGFNMADLAWGTANAQAVTLSFRVYSSLTGTFGGSITNAALNYCYPFSYSIPVANTWTTITVTVAGPTAGTWVGAVNTAGIYLIFGLGGGATVSGTAGSWASASYYTATGATSVVGTNGATFYITGVQLEKGSTATSFDYRPYTTELQLCQRYYFKNIPGVAGSTVAAGVFNGTTNLVATLIFPVPMRIAPTMTQTTMNVANGVTGNAVTSIGTQAFGVNSGLVVMNGTSASYATGQGGYLYTSATSSYVDFTAEL